MLINNFSSVHFIVDRGEITPPEVSDFPSKLLINYCLNTNITLSKFGHFPSIIILE